MIKVLELGDFRSAPKGLKTTKPSDKSEGFAI